MNEFFRIKSRDKPHNRNGNTTDNKRAQKEMHLGVIINKYSVNT